MKNQTNSIIGVILGMHRIWFKLEPEELAAAVNIRFVFLDSLLAFLLSVVHYFAVEAKFSDPGSIRTTFV
jgi:hypothetical protein